jgi:hypothetical protein
MASPRAAVFPGLSDFKPGSLRGTPGFFRVGQTRAGQWWLLDAQDRPFFSKAVAAVSRTGWADGRPLRPGRYVQTVNQLYGPAESESFVRSVLQRARKWNLNTLGAWTAPEFYDRGIAYTELIEFRKVGPCFHSGTALLPDVFDPAWRDAADAWARQICAPRKERRELIGYFTDHELGWAQPPDEQLSGMIPADTRDERPSLLQICLSLEPSFRAYHAAWEFVLAPRQGDLARLAVDWKLALSSRETIRQLTQAETPLLSLGYLHDQNRFAREFSRRYFAISAAVIRNYDPHHLILGCRFAQLPGSAVLAECVQPNVDVVSIHPGRETWDRTAQLSFSATGMPVLLTELNWADPAFARASLKAEKRRLTSLERMLGKGRLGLERVFSHRGIVGYEWSRWVDGEDEEPPFARGLVHLDDREAREHTELLTDLNARAEVLRLKSR